MSELPARGRAEPPHFATGVAALPRALAELLQTPALWPVALVPVLIFLALSGGFATAALLVARPFFVEHLPPAESTLGRLGAGAAGWAFALLLVLAGWYVALALAPTLSAPALERIVDHVERRLGLPPRAPLGFFRELWCGLRSLAGAACLALPLTLLLWLVGLVLPAAAPFTTSASALFGAWLVAWGLFDYPLTLRGLGFRERLRLMRENFGCVTGFGAVFALVFWLPCCGVVLLPVGALAATRLASAILFPDHPRSQDHPGRA